MSASGWIHLEGCSVRAVSEKAILLVLDDGQLAWMPKSQIDDWERLAVGD